EGHGNTLRGAIPLARSGLIASAAWDGLQGRRGALRLWDAATGDPVAVALEPGEIVYGIAAARDGATLAATVVRDVGPAATYSLLFLNTLTGRSTRVRARDAGATPVFDPTSSRIATSDNANVRIRDADSGAEVASTAVEASCLDWSNAGQCLAVGT